MITRAKIDSKNTLLNSFFLDVTSNKIHVHSMEETPGKDVIE